MSVPVQGARLAHCVPADRSSTNDITKGAATSVEHGVAEATVRIRTSRQNWIVLFVTRLLILAMQTLQWEQPRREKSPAYCFGWRARWGIVVDEQLRGRRDPGVRERSRAPARHLRWNQAQAVHCFKQLSTDRVRLILENSQVVNMRAQPSRGASAPPDTNTTSPHRPVVAGIPRRTSSRPMTLCRTDESDGVLCHLMS